jgi:predicted transcriptional regulator
MCLHQSTSPQVTVSHDYVWFSHIQVQRAEENTRKAAQAQQAGESRLYEVQRAMEELQTELERVKRQLTQQQGRTEALQKRCDELAEETRKHKEVSQF